MTDATNAVLNPGSDEAVARGCQCPVLDNAHGRGYLGGVKGKEGNLLFVISGNCELHREWEPADD